MAKTHERIFALVGALLFLATSMALTIAVVWQMHTNGKNSAQTDAAQKALASQPKLQGTSLKGFTPTSKISKLQEIDQVKGTGKEAKAGDSVTVNYTGAVASTGVIFQSSLDTGQPAALSLSQVIKGWAEGIPGMKEGGTRRLLIPAALAYGASSPQGSGIPANADLVFDVQLVKVGQ